MTHLGAVVLQDLPHRGDHHLAQVARDPFLPRQGTRQDAAVAPRPPASSPHPTLVAFCRKETLPTSPPGCPAQLWGQKRQDLSTRPPHFGAGHPFPPKLLLPPGLGPRRRAGTAPAPRTWLPSPHHGTTPPAARRTRGGGWPRLGGEIKSRGISTHGGISTHWGGTIPTPHQLPIPPRVCPQARTDAAHPSHPDSPWLSQQHRLFFLFIYLTILLFIYFYPHHLLLVHKAPPAPILSLSPFAA